MHPTFVSLVILHWSSGVLILTGCLKTGDGNKYSREIPQSPYGFCLEISILKSQDAYLSAFYWQYGRSTGVVSRTSLLMRMRILTKNCHPSWDASPVSVKLEEVPSRKRNDSALFSCSYRLYYLRGRRAEPTQRKNWEDTILSSSERIPKEKEIQGSSILKLKCQKVASRW